MSTTKKIELGEIETTVAIFAAPSRNPNHRYVLHAGGLDAYSDWERAQPVTAIQRQYIFGHYIEDTSSDARWFLFCNVDCFDPPQYLIRDRSFESAYETFLQELGERACGLVEMPERIEGESDDDYWTRAEKDCDSPHMLDGGGLIDTAGVQGCEVVLVGIE